MYGGSTRAVKRRITEHMNVTRGRGDARFKVFKMAYAVIPDMSEADELEQQLLRRMEEAGLPMFSTRDAKKRSQA